MENLEQLPESPIHPSCLSFVSGHGTVATDQDGILCKGDDGKVRDQEESLLSFPSSLAPPLTGLLSLILESFILKDTLFPCKGTDKLSVPVVVNTRKLPLTPE